MKWIHAARLARKAFPALYVALGLGHPAVYALSAIALAAEFIPRGRGHDAVQSLAHLAAIAAVPPPYDAALALAFLPLLEASLRLNPRPWWAYVAPPSIALVLALPLAGVAPFISLLIPAAYVSLKALVEWGRMVTARIAVEADRKLRTVAGRRVSYVLTISSRPRLRGVRAVIHAPSEVRLERVGVDVGGDSVGAEARYGLGGVKRPMLLLELRSGDGLVSASRRAPHPPIIVTPRARRAVEVGERLLRRASVAGAGDVVEVREYVAGDPVRRIHWKKSLKLDKYVVKLMEAPEVNPVISVLAYASDGEAVDRLGAALASAVAALLVRSPGVRVILIGRRGERGEREVSPGNYVEAMDSIMGEIEAMNIRRLGGALGAAGLLADLVIARRAAVLRAARGAGVILGERAWLRHACRPPPRDVDCIAV
ncbi:hypothetical protein GCM10007981_00760 [Thermocladium modestius]|uniref:DUF58 domain-containing protein n=1 Tax=Thermocladium modestius TaxID=62609 RepID=A0A830GS83_9CREN|nr:DUF58 domain-containing protein [Thermocladium modestius]GGP18970.1 hypothetical protein GCM10007981_00760 [Thermocladium modestius]